MQGKIICYGSNVLVPNPGIYPMHQIVFCTEDALKVLRIEGSEEP